MHSFCEWVAHVGQRNQTPPWVTVYANTDGKAPITPVARERSQTEGLLSRKTAGRNNSQPFRLYHLGEPLPLRLCFEGIAAFRL